MQRKVGGLMISPMVGAFLIALDLRGESRNYAHLWQVLSDKEKLAVVRQVKNDPVQRKKVAILRATDMIFDDEVEDMREQQALQRHIR
jgi:hypothetical protein